MLRTMFSRFLLFFTLANYSLAQLTNPPAGNGERCFLGAFIPTLCEQGLTCVLTSFGNPGVDNPRVGTCQKLTETPPLCSIDLCSATGADTLCRASSFPSQPPDLVATCRAWATRSDDGGSGPDCNFFCTLECRVPPLVASDGSEFCNLCLLQAASCRSNFEIYGPVSAPDECQPPIAIFKAAKCCTERGIGCLEDGNRCSTAGSRIRPVPCKSGLTCVIEDFGFPAADRPNSGTCQQVSPDIPGCILRLCSRSGAGAVCKVLQPVNSGIVSTCKAWATRSDGSPGADCDFACPQGCLPSERRPVASDGTRYCNLCILTLASCESDFMIFGPVRG